MKSENKKVIELWKGDCQECQLISPIITDLNKNGYDFKQHNIAEEAGRKYWDKFEKEIDDFSEKQGWETGYIYTPTFIRTDNRKVMAVNGKLPSKEDLIKFAS